MPRLADGRYRIGGRSYHLRVRRPTVAATRILEPLKLHVTDVERFRSGRPVVGREHEEDPTEELLLLVVPHLPDLGPAIDQLSIEPAWQDAAWGVVSERGGYHLAVPGLPRPLSAPDRTSPGPAKSPLRNRDPVQRDLPAAILGLLLLRRADWSRVRIKPRCVHIETLQELAKSLGAGRSALYGALGELEDLGWVISRHGRMPELSDPPGLLTRFLDHAKHYRPSRVAVRPLYEAWASRKQVVSWLHDRADQPSEAPTEWAVTGWEACRRHDMSVLTNLDSKPVEVVITCDVEALMQRLHLQEASAPTPETLVLTRTSTPRAPLLGAEREGTSGVVLVDPWQAALAVAGDPQRGIEQATAIAATLWPAT